MREPNIHDTFDSLLEFAWSLTMIAGCAYFVFMQEASGWWFLLAIVFASCWETKYHKELDRWSSLN